MTMESPSDSGVQGTTSSSNGSPVGENPPMIHAMQPASTGQIDAQSTTSSQMTMAQVPVSMHQAFVMAPPTTSADTQQQHLMMQPPMSMPLMMSPYQMILPTHGLVDQQGHLIQQQQHHDSSGQQPGSPAVDSRSGSRSATPQQQAAALYHPQQLVQLKDGQLVKSDNEAVASPVRQGSVGSGGSPAPPTPGSLGSPLPQLMADGSMHPPHGVQYSVQPGFPAGINLAQNAATPPPEVKEEKVDISKLKPPKKPLTPYMRFSKAIWQQVKAANPSMSVCEIGATIGRMWRELADTEKQKYNEDFANDKINYDVELQRYLKITGLQASDLVKPRPKKKGSAKASDDSKPKRSHSRAAPSPQPQPTENQVVHQVPGQQIIGVPPMLHTSLNGPVPVSIQNSSVSAGIPQQVLSGALSGLPHFSQVWTGQQGATMLSQGMQAGGQEQFIVQQGAHGQQQVLINTLGLPAGTVVNGGTGQAAGENPNVISHPILIQPTGEQATQLFSTEGQEANKTEGEQPGTSQAATTQLLSWHQVMSANPGDLQHQQNVLNLLNMAAAQSGVQPDQLSQAAQIAGLQPPSGVPLGIQQVNVSTSDSNSESQTTTQGMDQHALHQQQQQQQQQATSTPQPNTVLVDQNGTPVVHSVSNGPSSSASQAVVTVPTAHNLYNSYGFNPWSAFPQQLVQTTTAGDGAHEAMATADGTAIAAQGGIQVVYNRESILETELQHLRSALSEKTKEVQRLTQDLEKAYSIIEQLKLQNPTAVIHLPAPTEQVGDPGTPQPATTT